MSSAIDSVQEAMKLLQEGFERINEANRVLSGGPQSYYFERMMEYVEVLFTRYAPFKKGDRVVIRRPPNCDNAWATHKQDLVRGAKGTVRDVDLYKGLWRADVELDQETWINDKGHRQPVTCKHTFCLSEREIERIV